MKIFKKIKKKNGRRHIYFCGIKIFSYKKTKKDLQNFTFLDYFNHDYQLYKYVEGYKQVLADVPPVKVSNKYTNCIWQLWLQGLDQRPELAKICMNSVQKYAGKQKIIVLTEQNLSNFIDIPEFIWTKYKTGIISPTHLSDYIRLCLLAKYGGTWIDASVLLTDKIPENILTAKFFAFKTRSWIHLKNVPLSDETLCYLAKQLKNENVFSCFANWFIHAEPNNIFIRSILKCLTEYWKRENTLLDYFIFHYFATMCVLNNPECQDVYAKMDAPAKTGAFLLYDTLFDKFNQQVFDDIKKQSSIHKLTWKHLKCNQGKDISHSFLEHL